MAGKALNKANLMALGTETLAELLLETVKGDAARQRRVRLDNHQLVPIKIEMTFNQRQGPATNRPKTDQNDRAINAGVNGMGHRASPVANIGMRVEPLSRASMQCLDPQGKDYPRKQGEIRHRVTAPPTKKAAPEGAA